MEALSLFKERRPHIIITDIEMPTMNGIALAKEVRAMDKDIPIIFLTAYNDTKYMLLSADLNVDSYVTKPVKKEELLTAIDKAIKKAFELQGKK